MGVKAERTRARILTATVALIAREGYASATIRAIATEAEIAEGTIYRHFHDKTAILLAALEEHTAPADPWLEALPDRAGDQPIDAALTEWLTRLARLRSEILPLEVAMLNDPELRAARRAALASETPPGPPLHLASYIAAEQRLGRIRSDVPPLDIAVSLLALLFGLLVADLGAAAGDIRKSVEIFVSGIEA